MDTTWTTQVIDEIGSGLVCRGRGLSNPIGLKSNTSRYPLKDRTQQLNKKVKYMPVLV
jgi:hypothetical protein